MVKRRQLAIGDARQRRNQRSECTRVAPHPKSFARKFHLVHRLLDLLLYSLGGEPCELWGTLDDGIPGIALDVETESRRETNRAQRTQTILAHSLPRVADGTNEPSLQILLPFVRIADFV